MKMQFVGGPSCRCSSGRRCVRRRSRARAIARGSLACLWVFVAFDGKRQAGDEILLASAVLVAEHGERRTENDRPWRLRGAASVVFGDLDQKPQAARQRGAAEAKGLASASERIPYRNEPGRAGVPEQRVGEQLDLVAVGLEPDAPDTLEWDLVIKLFAVRHRRHWLANCGHRRRGPGDGAGFAIPQLLPPDHPEIGANFSAHLGFHGRAGKLDDGEDIRAAHRPRPLHLILEIFDRDPGADRRIYKSVSVRRAAWPRAGRLNTDAAMAAAARRRAQLPIGRAEFLR